MLVTFSLLIAAVAVSPFAWFVWWMVADLVQYREARRPAVVVAMPRAADRYDKAA